MSYTLADLTYMVARELGIITEGTATGGAVNTLIDTVGRTEADDFWNGGTCWILYDAGGAGAAPEGEVKEIADFTSSSSTITFRNAMTIAPALGDFYALAYKYVPLNILRQKVNQALLDYGPIVKVDTSLTTIANQTEIDLPADVKMKLLQVFIEENVGDVDDNQWRELFNWEVKPSTTGIVDQLILAEQPTTGRSLKIVYLTPLSDLMLYTGSLDEHVSVERIVYPAVRDCFAYLRENRIGGKDWGEQVARWEQRAEAVRARNPQRFPTKPGRILLTSQSQYSNYPGDRNPR